MDIWDGLIIALAAYVAVMSLVRLMGGRRNELIDEVQREIERHRGARPLNKAAERSPAGTTANKRGKPGE